MGKDKQNTKNKPVVKQQKAVKLPEIEDFFTISLAKKNRNLNKKIEKIQELETRKKAGDELNKDQNELIERKGEVTSQISENNRIKTIYLEAYSKKDETDGEVKKEEVKKVEVVAPKVEEVIVEEEKKPEVNLEEVESKGVTKATHAISKFLVASHLLRTQHYVEQFAEQSGLSGLEELSTINSAYLDNTSNNNWEKYLDLQKMLENFVNKSPVLTSENKSVDELHELVESVTSHQQFAQFTPVDPAPVEVVVQVAALPERKESDISKKQSRKESEIQQDFFMQDSDEEDDEEIVQNQVVEIQATEEKIVEAKAPETKEKQPLQEQQVSSNQAQPELTRKKSEAQKAQKSGDADKDEDEDEWFTATRGPKYGANQGPNPNYKGKNPRGGNYRGGERRGGERRGGEGRGGERRGGYRGERKEGDGRVERKDGEGRVERGDGYKEGGERRSWNNEGGFRKENTGRGRGGYRGTGRGGNRYSKDGERKPYNKGSENERPSGEPLKEVGTLEKEVMPVEESQPITE